MITGIDTNILSALLAQESGYPAILEQIHRAFMAGPLVICAAVYAELLAHPLGSPAQLDEFLEDTDVTIDYLAEPKIWRLAGSTFGRYTERRRKSGGGEPSRLLVDFIVGAHASLKTDRLFTLDRKRYSRDFPKLRLY